MAALTLFESAKLAANQGQSLRAGITQVFAQSALLNAMPFETISGHSYIYRQEGALPGVAFRNINDTYTPTAAVINPQTETLKVIGSELKVDTALVDMHGPGVRSENVIMHGKAIAQTIAVAMIEGNSITDIKSFDGLRRRLNIAGDQVITAGSGSGGAPLSMSILDQAIQQVQGPTHLLMRKSVIRAITKFMRTSASLSQTRDEWGNLLMTYNGLPILEADPLGHTACITATEEESGSEAASTATSIYVLSFREGYLHGIQSKPLDMRDLGELQAAPAYGNRIEWIMGMVLNNPFSACRLRHVHPSATVVG